MTTVCSSTPTATTTTLVPTFTQRVTITDSVTTFPGSPVVSVFPTTSCFGGDPDDCIDIDVTTLVTLPGPVVTSQIPLTIAIDTFIVQTTTLFGQACSVVTSPGTPGSPSPNTSPTPTPRIPPSGSRSGSSVIPSQTSSLQDPLPSVDGTTEKPFPIAAVAGGAVGGLVVVALLGLFLWKYFHKPSPPNLGNHEAHPDKYSSFGKEDVVYQSNLAPPSQQPPPGQQSTPNQSTQQQQQQQQQQQVDECGTSNGDEAQQSNRPERLPGRLEQKLAQKINSTFKRRRSNEENPNEQPVGSPQFPQAQIPNYGQGYYQPQQTTTQQAVIPTQQITTSYPTSPAWGRPASNQFNVAAPGIPHAQVTPATQHLQTQYTGYAEPSQ